ncbi:MAG: hypothetical protein GOV02_00690 [Candidatus Aenigmarchaeota archaeon]|nr:hypothetical protein [Candidatus Aenigmarchaeota archaeon]
MKGAVTVIEAILIIFVVIGLLAILIPWVSSSLDKSSQISEIQTLNTQMGLCNEKLEETGRVGSANTCIFSISNGKMHAETDGIYYELISDLDICDETDWTEIEPENHLWQKCDIVDQKTIYSTKWAWVDERQIIGEGISGNIYRYNNPISSITFNNTTTFRTLTVFIEFDFTPGQAGNIIQINRKSVEEDKITLNVDIK